MYIKNVKMKI
ncbi:hypothetical protein [Plasmodium yoelii yoelii]|uniref:Uncharacterized protein n=1 Tax=Plasmodium yoelii yoelii TaxID=73239 RepID=Q7RH60_PLAYO|nr:hypothetical protein [Plasmodium yoelii yoelii]